MHEESAGDCAPENNGDTQEEALGRDDALRAFGKKMLQTQQSSPSNLPTQVGTIVTPTGGPLIGIQVGNFKIISVLGAGGFGKVYKAMEVAIKFLHETNDTRRQELFEREEKALAKLSSQKSIVEIYQWGAHGNRNYFELEYVTSDVEKLIEEHPGGIPLMRALEIAVDCVDALAAAHKKGILHRDIKPPNILIEEKSDAVKVADFGLAKLRTSEGFTLDGSVSGSPAYMSPEQAHGDSLDERTDVFSLGTTFYEMLTAERPFEGETSEEMMKNIHIHPGGIVQ